LIRSTRRELPEATFASARVFEELDDPTTTTASQSGASSRTAAWRFVVA
jgi:hypothetical protein